MRKGLEEQHSIAKNTVENLGYNVMLSGYIGSHHLQLTDEKSDYDFVFYVLPTKEQLYKRSLINEGYDLNEDLGFQILSWLGLGKHLHQASYNLFEIIVDPLYISSKVSKEVKEIIRLMSTEKDYKKRLVKNYYFMGSNQLKMSKRKPETGSRVQHYDGEVDYKSLAKAWLHYRVLSGGLNLWDLYTENKLPEYIEQEFKDIRINQHFTKFDELELFYGNDTAKEYAKLSYVSDGYFGGVNKMLAEPLRYVFE